MYTCVFASFFEKSLSTYIHECSQCNNNAVSVPLDITVLK